VKAERIEDDGKWLWMMMKIDLRGRKAEQWNKVEQVKQEMRLSTRPEKSALLMSSHQSEF
jgi:hypothetical protein